MILSVMWILGQMCWGAQPYAKVGPVVGEIWLNGKPAKSGDVITGKTRLRTRAGSKVKIDYHNPHGTLTLVGAGTMDLPEASDGDHEVVLEQGTARWKVTPGVSPKRALRLRTRSSVMGVRGTDFMAVSNPVFGESEIIVFEGKVQFKSSLSDKDEREVNAGQWGGVGGRFRQKIGDLIDLPPNVLSVFDQQTRF